MALAMYKVNVYFIETIEILQNQPMSLTLQH